MMTWLYSLSISFLLVSGAAASEARFHSWYQVLSEEESHQQIGMPIMRSLDGSSIKALVWNIKKAEMEDWQDEFMAYGQDKDLVLLQEAYRNEIFDSTISSFDGYRWDMGISFVYTRHDHIPTGTMIGAQALPEEITVKHSPDREPITNTPKAITFARYPITDSDNDLLVVSVHAINFVTTGSFRRQMLQVKGEIEKHIGPVIFAGDFNTWTGGRTSFLMELALSLGMEPVKFKNGDKRKKFGKYFLDHGFVRGLTVHKAEVLEDSKGSDHGPMVLEVSVTELDRIAQ